MYTLLFVFWLILNQKVTLEIVIFGIAVTGLTGALMNVLFDYSIHKELRYLKKVPLFALYVLVLVREIVKSSINMVRIIFDKSVKVEPTLVTFHSGLKTEFGNFLLANSITLTPGTITVEAYEDELTVHCLRRDFLDTDENSVFIRYIRRMESK